LSGYRSDLRLAAAAAVAAILAFGCGGVRDRTRENGWRVKLSHVYTAASDYQLMAERLRKLMHEKTDGRFRLAIYPSGQLGDERVCFEQLQMGALEMAISGTPVLSSWVPEGQVFDLPFLFETREHGLAALDGALGGWWRGRLLMKTGVRSLGFLDYGFRHVYNRRRSIHGPEDLKGLKLRVLQSPTYLAAYAAFDVQATPMAYGEVYSGLQQGVIDGGEANAIGFVTDRFYEVARHFSFTAITYNPITLLINEQFYQSLPAGVREALDASVAQALAFQRSICRRMEAEAVERMRAEGVVITIPDLEAFAPLARPVWRELEARLEGGTALVDWVRREVGQAAASP
jgi:tripartite ATP-independent transporter DctP family solute receptor